MYAKEYTAFTLFIKEGTEEKTMNRFIYNFKVF